MNDTNKDALLIDAGKIPQGARLIMQTFENTGYEAFIVGGCVRDLLMGRDPHDWDICTDAKPEEIKECFKDYKVLETGIKHGTVTIMITEDDKLVPYEVTTYRIDGKYSDGRHPDSVEFTRNILEDLSRRDFTINAMAYNDVDGLLDPFGGLQDLKDHCIKTVGRPWERFREDALRILRALRFSSVFNFYIDYSTAKEVHEMRENLLQVSAERIQVELMKMLAGKGCLRALRIFPSVISTIIPELGPCIGFDQKNKYHSFDVYNHTCYAVDNYKGSDVTIRLALLLHDIGKPKTYTVDENGHGHFYGHPHESRNMAEVVLDRLKFDNKTKQTVLGLIENHGLDLKPINRSVRRILNQIGEERFRQLIDFRRADTLAHSPVNRDNRMQEYDDVERVLNTVIENQQAFRVKDLKINGRDIMTEFHVEQGKRIGKILQYLLQQVIDDKLENTRESLILATKDYLDQ